MPVIVKDNVGAPSRWRIRRDHRNSHTPTTSSHLSLADTKVTQIKVSHQPRISYSSTSVDTQRRRGVGNSVSPCFSLSDLVINSRGAYAFPPSDCDPPNRRDRRGRGTKKAPLLYSQLPPKKSARYASCMFHQQKAHQSFYVLCQSGVRLSLGDFQTQMTALSTTSLTKQV